MFYDLPKELSTYLENRSQNHILRYDFRNFVYGLYPKPVPPSLARNLKEWVPKVNHKNYEPMIRKIALGLWLHYGQYRYEISVRKFIDIVRYNTSENQRDMIISDLSAFIKKIDIEDLQ